MRRTSWWSSSHSTQLKIGGPIGRDQLKARYLRESRDWRVEDSGAARANLAEAGWTIRQVLPDSHRAELIRTMGGTGGVGHIVLSDGLAAIFGVHRACDEQAAGAATGSGAAGRDQRLHAPGGQLLGYGSRRSACGERKIHRQRCGIPQVKAGDLRRITPVPAAGGDVAVFRQPDLGDSFDRESTVCLSAAASALFAQGRELPDFTDLAERQGPTVVNISTTQVREAPCFAGKFRISKKTIRSTISSGASSRAAGSRRTGPARFREPFARLGLHHQHRRLRTHQRARRRFCR